MTTAATDLLEREAALRAGGAMPRMRDLAAALAVPEAALVEARRTTGAAERLRPRAHRLGEGGDHAESSRIRGCDEHPAAVRAQVEGRVEIGLRHRRDVATPRNESDTLLRRLGQVVRHTLKPELCLPADLSPSLCKNVT